MPTMAEREVLARIERHMARGNDLLGEVRDEMRLSREERERSREMFEHHAELYSDLREFTREMILRVERGGREQVVELRKLGSAFDALRDELRDMRGETRAQTRAILRVLDKLDRSDAGGADATA
jgi:hypothetical protein